MWRTSAAVIASLALLPAVLGTDILHTNGFSNCNTGESTVKVNNVDISFDKSTNNVDFDVSGTSSKEQFVTAELLVTAYGVKVYNNTFDPCSDDTKVEQLCPGKSKKLSTPVRHADPLQYPQEHFPPTALKPFRPSISPKSLR